MFKTEQKRAGGLWQNLRFVLRELHRCAPRSFRFIWISIPVKVALPFIGILLPNLVVRAVTEHGSAAALMQAVLALGLLAVSCSFLDQYGAGVMEAEQDKLCKSFDTQLLRRHMDCDYEKLENKAFYDRYYEISRYIWDFQRYLNGAALNLTLLGSGVFGFALYLSVLRTLPVWLLLLLAACAAAGVFTSGFGDKERGKRKMYRGNGLFGYLQRTTCSPKAGKDVRLYQMYPWIEEHFDRAMRIIRSDYGAVEKKNFLSAVCTAVLGIVMELAAYVTLTSQVVGGTISAADYVLYIGAVLGFSTWVRQIVNQAQRLWMMKGDVSAIRSMLEEEDRSETLRRGEKTVPVSEACPPGKPCSLSFRNVSFRYPGAEQDTLHGLSFEIRPGERIALVGMNGAGKTTCVKLLCGLLEPTEGEVLVNGVPVRQFDRRAYFRLFATVFQEVNLFPGTLREAVSCLEPGSEDEARLRACLAKAELSGLIDRLPAGLDTLLVPEVNEGAVSLSGGEQQRLLLARALYKDAPILVLDEPTAALDPIAEEHVYRQYRAFTQNTTSVFISHRLASTRFCDRIFFLENGRIAEIGSHEELIAAAGAYAKAFEVQSRYYRDHPEETGEEAFA